MRILNEYTKVNVLQDMTYQYERDKRPNEKYIK